MDDGTTKSSTIRGHGLMSGCDSARISSLRNRATAKHSLARHTIAGSLARSLRLQRRRIISWIFNQRFISATIFHAGGMSGRCSQTTGHFVPAVSQRRTQGLWEPESDEVCSAAAYLARRKNEKPTCDVWSVPTLEACVFP